MQQDVSLLNEYKAAEIFPLSSTSVLIVFGDMINITINEKVTALYLLIKQKNLGWVKDLTPAYTSLGVDYDIYFIKANFNIKGLVFDWVKSTLLSFIEDGTAVKMPGTEIVEIPICFDETFPNDLCIMSKTLGLSAADIIAIFLSKTYHVFMLGFLPGFTYMGEVDSRIDIHRKTDPTITKAGAVGIAGKQTGIYPLDSLGGWHILGFTPINLFQPNNNPPNFLATGNKIKFIQIDVVQYNVLKNKIDN